VTEKIKLMGRIEYALGLVYGIIISAYAAGLEPSPNILIGAALFTVAYFGHWVMLLLQTEQQNRLIIKQLEVTKLNVGIPSGDTATDTRESKYPT